MTEKKGCQVVLVIIGVALAAGMVLTGQMGANNQGETQTIPAVTVNGTTYSAEQIDTLATNFATNQNIDRADPQNDFQAVAAALTNIVGEVVVQNLANQAGLKASDEKILTTAEEQLKSQIEMFKIQLQLSGQLKEGAKPEEVEAAFTKAAGKSSQQIMADQMTQLKEEIKKPEVRKQMELQTLAKMVQDDFNAKVEYSEEDLRKSYDLFKLEEIAFDASKETPEKIEELAEQARAELEAGKSPAEVRKKFAPESKRTTVDLPRDMLEGSAVYEPILKMEAGQVSDPIQPFGFTSVFKLVKVEPKLPPDFEKNKANLIKTRKDAKGQEEFSKLFNDARDAVKLEWKDDGLRLIWDLATIISDPDLNMKPDELTTKLNDILTQSKGSLGAASSMRHVALAAYVASDRLLTVAKPEDREMIETEWLDNLNTVLTYYESIQVRLAAAQTLMASKQNDAAAEMILEAARANGDYETTGKNNYDQINLILKSAKDSKAFSDEQVKNIEAELQKWLTAKVEFEKEQKEIEAENQKAMEELDKEEEAAKKEEAAAAKTNDKTTGGN